MVMKKTKYIAPDFTFTEYIEEEMICVVSGVRGNAGIEMGEGEGEAPTKADSRSYSVWGDDEEE